MGPTLVQGVVKIGGAMVECDSRPGAGTTFKLQLPPPRSEANPTTARSIAVVDVTDLRMAAVATQVLLNLSVEVKVGDGAPPKDAAIWVTDRHSADEIVAFVRGPEKSGKKAGASVVVLGVGSDLFESSGSAIDTGTQPSLGVIRAAIERSLGKI